MCMHYMMDIETHTVIYLRDLLGTRRQRSSDHGLPLLLGLRGALARRGLLRLPAGAYGIELPAEPKLPDGRTPMPTRATRTGRLREQLGVGHQLSLLPTMAGSMLLRDFIALHMTWGAINELTTLTGYHALIRRSDHPVLHAMLRRVIQDERRHFAFYRARGRPGWRARRAGCGASSASSSSTSGRRSAPASSRRRRSTRWRSTCSAATSRGASSCAIDRTVAEFPGLEGLRLVEQALDEALERARRRPGWAGVTPAPAVDARLRGAGSEAWGASREAAA